MKYINLLRHAKSDWNQVFNNDWQRGLNQRGKQSVTIMAQKLEQAQLTNFDAIYSSDSVRTTDTILGIAKLLNIPKGKINFLTSLYGATAENIFALLRTLPDTQNNIMVVAHNPSLTYLTNKLDSDFHLDNLPTCGFVRLELEIKHWQDLQPNAAQVNTYLCPK